MERDKKINQSNQPKQLKNGEIRLISLGYKYYINRFFVLSVIEFFIQFFFDFNIYAEVEEEKSCAYTTATKTNYIRTYIHKLLKTINVIIYGKTL